MKKLCIIPSIALFMAVSLSAVADIAQLSQMFQRVRVSDIPKSTEWDKAMEATREKLDAMNLSVTESDLLHFFGDIKAFNQRLKSRLDLKGGISKQALNGLKDEAVRLEQQYQKDEQSGPAQPEQKKGFFSKMKAKVKATFSRKKNDNQANQKSSNSEEDRMMDLLQGAFDLLKAKLNSLK